MGDSAAPRWKQRPVSAPMALSKSRREHMRDYLAALIPLSSFLCHAFLLTNLLHYSTLPSMKIWSWPKTWAAESSDSATYSSWFTLEFVVQLVSLVGSVYLFTAVLVSIVGFIGILRKQSTTIRFYRDCAIADLSFCAALTLVMGYCAFFYSQLGVGLTACEELSKNPVIMRSLSIDIENCEQCVERWLLGSIIGMVVVLVIRLHAILFISKHYTHIATVESQRHLPMTMNDLADDRRHHHHHSRSHSSGKRVFLISIPGGFSEAMPNAASTSTCTTPISSLPPTLLDEQQVTVYTPTTMTLEQARQVAGTGLREAWVPGRRSSHHHKHHRQHHHRKSSSSVSQRPAVAREDTWVDSADEDEGAISLPVYPGEALSTSTPMDSRNKA